LNVKDWLSKEPFSARVKKKERITDNFITIKLIL
jgi:hypothetical protein